MIVLQEAMPDKCKKCKERGGLEDGLYLIHTEEDYVNFYCDSQSPKTCPIKGEIPDKHGRIVDIQNVMNQITICFAECKLKNIEVTPFILATYIAKAPTVLEANE